MPIPRPQDPDDRKWAEKAHELELTELELVKAAADKWSTSTASVTGVFGIIVLIKGPDDISTLTAWYKNGAGIALIIAVACALTAILLAALAAQGVPKKMYLTGPAVRRKSRIAAGTAANRLFASRILVIPAVIAMGFAIGFTWYGSRVPEPTTTAVSEEGSGKICGELRRDAEGHLTSTSTNQWP